MKTGMYRGIIEDVNDAEKRGRYRIRVLGIHEDDYPTEHLPWAETCGVGGAGWGDFSHLEVGNLVWVMFEHGDRMLPVVMGGWLTAPNGVSDLPSEQTGDYPADRARWVKKDRVGNQITLSEKSGEKGITIKAGDDVELILSQETNSWVLTVKGPITVNTEDAVTIAAQGAVSVEGDGVTIEATGSNTTVKAATNVAVEAGGDILLEGGGLAANGKIVTTLHNCAFTGAPHPFGSSNCKASL